MKKILYNALDRLIGLCWNTAGRVLNALDPKGKRLIKSLRKAHKENRDMPRLTHAQLERLRAKVRKEFPPL
jgi:hypothetical protein